MTLNDVMPLKIPNIGKTQQLNGNRWNHFNGDPWPKYIPSNESMYGLYDYFYIDSALDTFLQQHHLDDWWLKLLSFKPCAGRGSYGRKIN